MPLFHALFSGGTILGAALGAAAEFAGISIAVHLAIVGAAMIVGVLFAVRYLQPDPFACRSGRRRSGRAAHRAESQRRLAVPARYLA